MRKLLRKSLPEGRRGREAKPTRFPSLSEDELREAIASAFRKGPPCISGCRSYWEAIEEGLVSWGGGKPSGSSKPVKIRGQPLLELVLEDRG